MGRGPNILIVSHNFRNRVPWNSFPLTRERSPCCQS
jgi:hypothetical protein